ncbi:sulfate ABC transporter substrate-binding protein [Paenibacillus beijingensis]|uniref:Sulfate ABC transporter substrate-binding protein n=2 Tax=Paenibacillus beijingensis TaxID=1126833 RepID=A0A0D5NR16_9BACL|nr:sulfate ABC transporter substrate-binding protein [Paenibacillus beijingensis]
MRPSLRWGALILLALSVLVSGCAGSGGQTADGESKTAAPAKGDVTLVIGAYSTLRDVMQTILPEFQTYWKQKTGQTVTFQESYEASGTQARAIVGGFEADVALLSLDGDLQKIKDAGLITHDWSKEPDGGMITRSIAVIGVRKGNPLHIAGWEDLMGSRVKVLYPNPQTSGGAQWDINAMYGAGLKKSEAETGKKDPAYGKAYLERIHANIESLDKSGRASMAAFEYGVGDAIVTYENELIARIQKGVPYDIVIPRDTMLIENPGTVVDRNADKHGTREVAEAFMDFLRGKEAQTALAENGFRPVNAEVEAAYKDRFTVPQGLFDIEYLGGWDEVKKTLYSKRGIWYQVLAGI